MLNDMQRSRNVDIDVKGTIRALHKANVDVHKAMPAIVARLVSLGETFMKRRCITPWRTGKLSGGIHGYPTIRPTGIAANVTYAFAANVRSKNPGFIERTQNYIEKIAPEETQQVIKNITSKV